MSKSRANELRELLVAEEPVLMPAVGNALYGRVAQAVGYEALFMSGALSSLYYAGVPDLGLMTMTETVAVASRIQDAVTVPLHVDVDAGYGSALNVQRMTAMLIRAGVAGIQLEDQVEPKRTFSDPRKRVLPLDEALGKLRAALDTRRHHDSDLVIVARSDALRAADGGLEELIRRVKAYSRLGVDGVMCPGVRKRAEFNALKEAAGGLPVITAYEGYQDLEPPAKTPTELRALGVGGVILIEALGVSPIVAYWDAAKARLAAGIKWDADFIKSHIDHQVGDIHKVWKLIGIDEYERAEQKYLRPIQKRDRGAERSGGDDNS